MFEKTQPKNSIVKPENINYKEWYTFTINPCDTYQYFKDKDRVNSFHKYWDSYFYLKLTTKDIADVELRLEVSPLGRLHYHGMIQFRNLEAFFVDIIHDLTTIATIEIDKINDKEIWDNYVTKQNIIFPPRIISTASHLIKISNSNGKNIIEYLSLQ